MKATDRVLEPGPRRGLQKCANAHNIFTILAVDHGASLAATMRPEAPGQVGYEELAGIKAQIVGQLAPLASAVLLDPIYGLAPAVLGDALPGQTGLLLAVEDGDYASTAKEVQLFPGWSVAQAARAGADAIKCFFYYHPDDTAVAEHQERFVRQLVLDCQAVGLPLFAEPLSYDVTPATRSAVVLETARRIGGLGIDVLKVEFPIDARVNDNAEAWSTACQTLSAQCAAPWVLLSAGVNFSTFVRQVTTACRAGASGYVAGRAIWQEGVVLSGAAQQDFWQTTAPARLRELSEIAVAWARPWTDFYPPDTQVAPRGWHQEI